MKRIILLLFTAVTVFLTVSCGKKSEIIPSELADLMNNNIAFSESLTKLDNAAAERIYYLNPNDYTEISAYIGTKATCDELVIITSSNIDDIVSKLKSHLEMVKNNYSDYRPSEAAKIDNAVIETYKNTVVMVVSGDSDKVRQVYQDYLKK